MLQCTKPCTKLQKGEQKDRTKTLAEVPDHILNDYIYIYVLINSKHRLARALTLFLPRFRRALAINKTSHQALQFPMYCRDF